MITTLYAVCVVFALVSGLTGGNYEAFIAASFVIAAIEIKGEQLK